MNNHLSFQAATKAGGSEPPAKGIDGRTHFVSYNPKVTHQSYSYTFLINFNWQPSILLPGCLFCEASGRAPD